MKKLLTCLVCGSIIAGFATCKKEKDCEILYNNGGGMGISSLKNEQFEISLKLFHSDDAEVAIVKQSKHFVVSELKKVNADWIYRYKPSLNYVGADSVFFRSRNCAKKTITNTSIKISVTD
jgi:hypothetical protein